MLSVTQRLPSVLVKSSSIKVHLHGARTLCFHRPVAPFPCIKKQFARSDHDLIDKATTRRGRETSFFTVSRRTNNHTIDAFVCSSSYLFDNDYRLFARKCGRFFKKNAESRDVNRAIVRTILDVVV